MEVEITSALPKAHGRALRFAIVIALRIAARELKQLASALKRALIFFADFSSALRESLPGFFGLLES